MEPGRCELRWAQGTMEPGGCELRWAQGTMEPGGCELRWAQGTMEPGSPQWKEQLLGGAFPWPIAKYSKYPACG